jgi:hypothetical protein
MAAAARSFIDLAPAATFCPTAAPLMPPPALAEPAWNADFALLAVEAIERAPLAAIFAAPGAIRTPAATALPTPVAAAPTATAAPA